MVMIWLSARSVRKGQDNKSADMDYILCVIWEIAIAIKNI